MRSSFELLQSVLLGMETDGLQPSSCSVQRRSRHPTRTSRLRIHGVSPFVSPWSLRERFPTDPAFIASRFASGTVKIWDLIHGTCLATLEGHVSLVGLLGISPTHLVSAAADSTIKVWDANSLACTQTLTAHTGAITCFQHDETKIVSGSEGTLKLWDVRDGSFVRDLVTGVQGVWQVAFSGRYLVSASNRIGITVCVPSLCFVSLCCFWG